MALILTVGFDVSKNEDKIRKQLDAAITNMSETQLTNFSSRVSGLTDIINEVAREAVSRVSSLSSTSSVSTTAPIAPLYTTAPVASVATTASVATSITPTLDDDIKVGDTVRCGVSGDEFVVSKIEDGTTASYDPNNSETVTFIYSSTGSRYQKQLCKKVVTGSTGSIPVASVVTSTLPPIVPPPAGPTGTSPLPTTGPIGYTGSTPPKWNTTGAYNLGDRVTWMGLEYEYIGNAGDGNNMPGSSEKRDYTGKVIEPKVWQDVRFLGRPAPPAASPPSAAPSTRGTIPTRGKPSSRGSRGTPRGRRGRGGKRTTYRAKRHM